MKIRAFFGWWTLFAIILLSLKIIYHRQTDLPLFSIQSSIEPIAFSALFALALACRPRYLHKRSQETKE
jgi:hypothetical protein